MGSSLVSEPCDPFVDSLTGIQILDVNRYTQLLFLIQVSFLRTSRSLVPKYTIHYEYLSISTSNFLSFGKWDLFYTKRTSTLTPDYH